jgi:hypothetical protein
MPRSLLCLFILIPIFFIRSNGVDSLFSQSSFLPIFRRLLTLWGWSHELCLREPNGNPVRHCRKVKKIFHSSTWRISRASQNNAHGSLCSFSSLLICVGLTVILARAYSVVARRSPWYRRSSSLCLTFAADITSLPLYHCALLLSHDPHVVPFLRSKREERFKES